MFLTMKAKAASKKTAEVDFWIRLTLAVISILQFVYTCAYFSNSTTMVLLSGAILVVGYLIL